MTEWNHGTLSFSRCRRRRLREDFSGGSISSNAGALLLRELDRQMGLTAQVARALGDLAGFGIDLLTNLLGKIQTERRGAGADAVSRPERLRGARESPPPRPSCRCATRTIQCRVP